MADTFTAVVRLFCGGRNEVQVFSILEFYSRALETKAVAGEAKEAEEVGINGTGDGSKNDLCS